MRDDDGESTERMEEKERKVRKSVSRETTRNFKIFAFFLAHAGTTLYISLL